MEEFRIKGNSGCKLEKYGNNLLKISDNPSYFDRFLKQVEKQKTFQPFSVFKVPEIYDISEKSDKLVVEMEYITAQTFVELFSLQNWRTIGWITHMLEDFIEHEIESSTLTTVDLKLFQDKLDQIVKQVPDLPFRSELRKYLEYKKEIRVPVGSCHGDLTLSNILFTETGKIYLVDFLGGFIETPLQDIAKLRQDTKHKWSLGRINGFFNRMELEMSCNLVDIEFDLYFSKYSWYREHYNLFQIFNLIRIFPYSKDTGTRMYLTHELSNLFNDLAKPQTV